MNNQWPEILLLVVAIGTILFGILARIARFKAVPRLIEMQVNGMDKEWARKNRVIISLARIATVGFIVSFLGIIFTSPEQMPLLRNIFGIGFFGFGLVSFITAFVVYRRMAND